MKEFGYRLCSECGRLDLLGEKKQMEEEEERVFITFECEPMDLRWQRNPAHVLWISLEDPSMCDECFVEYTK